MPGRPAVGPPSARSAVLPPRKQETSSVARAHEAALAPSAEAVVFASKANVLAPTVIHCPAVVAKTRTKPTPDASPPRLPTETA